MRLLDGYVYLDTGEEGRDVRVNLRIEEEALTLATADQILGTWTRFGWGAEQVAPDRFQISLDEERFIFVPDDLLEFKYEVIPELVANESGVSFWTRLKHWLGSILGSRGKVAAPLAVPIVGLAVLGLALVALGLLALISWVLGAVLLLVGIVAQMDPHVAAKFPGSWTPDRALLLGLVMFVGGGVLGLLS